MKKQGICLVLLIICFCMMFTSASAAPKGLVCDVQTASDDAQSTGTFSPYIEETNRFKKISGIVLRGESWEREFVTCTLTLPIDGKTLAQYSGISFYIQYLQKHELSNRCSVFLENGSDTFYQNDLRADGSDRITMTLANFKNSSGFSIRESELKKVRSITFQFYGYNRTDVEICVAAAISDIYGCNEDGNLLPKIKDEQAVTAPEEEPEQLATDRVKMPVVWQAVGGVAVLALCVAASVWIYRKKKK